MQNRQVFRKCTKDNLLKTLILNYMEGVVVLRESEHIRKNDPVWMLENMIKLTKFDDDTKLLTKYLTKKYDLKFNDCNSSGSVIVVKLCEYYQNKLKT